MSLVERVKSAVTSERKDKYRCDECAELFHVEPGTEVDACPTCDAERVTLISRRAKV